MHEERLKKTDQGQKCWAFPNKPTPGMPVVFDETKCTGCNRCVNICMTDVLLPNPEKGKPPIIMYPEECWYGGDCVGECPVEGAVRLRHPLLSRVHYKNKETGEIKRI